MRRFLRRVALLVVVILIAEGAAGVYLAARESRRGPVCTMPDCRHDPDLGWTTLENDRHPDPWRPGRVITTGRDGSRGLVFHPVVPDPARFRICFLGDSFVWGLGVADDETIPARIGAEETRIEAVNLGVNGHGLDQAWLRWTGIEDRWPCRVVVLVLIAHDLFRMELTVFSELPKPRLEIAGDGLRAIGQPVPDRFGVPLPGTAGSFVARLQFSHAARWLRRRLGIGLAPRNVAVMPAQPGRVPPAADVARRVLTDFRNRARARGTAFVLAYLPALPTVAHEPTAGVQWLSQVAGEEGIPFADLTPAIRSVPKEERGVYYRRDTHFTARGNALAARALLQELRRLVAEVPR